MKKEFRVYVTETYSKAYDVIAEDAEEAEQIADNLATDDMELAVPENMESRTMMVCCACCGVGDDSENMFYGTNENGETLCVCEECAKKLHDVISVKDLSNALNGNK